LSLFVSPGQKLDRAAITLLQRRYTALLDQDLDNVAAGRYPRALLYQFPLVTYLRCVPEALMDLPRFLWRSFSGRFDDLPADVDRSHYPPYYLRTFHWQTDGWLSQRSARLYDASVEFLFGGTADPEARRAASSLSSSAWSGEKSRNERPPPGAVSRSGPKESSDDSADAGNPSAEQDEDRTGDSDDCSTDQRGKRSELPPVDRHAEPRSLGDTGILSRADGPVPCGDVAEIGTSRSSSVC
jgi:hypothetical protein